MDPFAEQRVKRAIKSHNDEIRGKLRKAMRVDLNPRGSASPDALKTSVRDGLPRAVLDSVAPVADAETWTLAAMETKLKEAQGTLREVSSLFQRIRTKGKPEDQLAEPSVPLEKMADWMRNLAEYGQKQRLWLRIMIVNHDIFGHYHPKSGNIDIYWIANALFAARHSIPVEAVTYVTLSHELAHGYSQRGFDSDGHQWNNETFAKTDAEITEGIAQFYTRQCCENVFVGEADLVDVFELMSTGRHHAYTAYKGWLSDVPSPLEIMRAAMVIARKRPVQSSFDFKQVIRQTEHQQCGAVTIN